MIYNFKLKITLLNYLNMTYKYFFIPKIILIFKNNFLIKIKDFNELNLVTNKIII